MKTKLLILKLVIFLSSSTIFSQTNFNQSWICGSYGLKATFTGTNVTTYPYLVVGKYFSRGHSNICDSSGKLVLVSDGMNIYDSTLGFIDNGDTLLAKTYYIHEDGWSGYSQTSIFLPFSDGIYYLVTPDVTDSMFNWWYTPPFPHSAPFDRLLYHKIDMKANGGAGKVIQKAIPLLEHVELSKSQMMACKHANGKDWWLVKQWSESNKIVKFLIKKDSIEGPFYQTFAGNFSLYDQDGQSMFSQDGTKYATTCRGTNKIFLADFDRCTGELSNPTWNNVPNYSRHDPSDSTLMDEWTQGLTFSPNGRFLYVMKYWNILQLDLQDNDSSSAWYHVAGLDTTWSAFALYNCSYLGKNEKLYIGYFAVTDKELSVIDNPNNKGIACNFCPKCLSFGSGWGSATTPPCMPNYDLGAMIPCWPLDTGNVNATNEISIYPNPANTKFQIKCKIPNSKKELFNSVGQLIFTTNKNEIDVSNYAKGMYYIRVGNLTQKIIIE